MARAATAAEARLLHHSMHSGLHVSEAMRPTAYPVTCPIANPATAVCRLYNMICSATLGQSPQTPRSRGAKTDSGNSRNETLRCSSRTARSCLTLAPIRNQRVECSSETAASGSLVLHSSAIPLSRNPGLGEGMSVTGNGLTAGVGAGSRDLAVGEGVASSDLTVAVVVVGRDPKGTLCMFLYAVVFMQAS